MNIEIISALDLMVMDGRIFYYWDQFDGVLIQRDCWPVNLTFLTWEEARILVMEKKPMKHVTVTRSRKLNKTKGSH